MTAQIHQLLIPRRANQALDAPLTEAAENVMIAAAAHKISELLDSLQIDHQNDHNTRETPERVARMSEDSSRKQEFLQECRELGG